ncbi:restriction endonuclease subunit S [Vibrio parahaemolyticus]|uniref:restriction endonuclease subunit S n=1 Tax=Vibrio parahaemolyticus TaxID=670 RepID=UPI000408838B|nr:restriction endonuclease subunit S [Vibrio parahaemolyticus]KIT59028.1 type I restriction endonuclease EcoAI subunit S [Vibrio parahaemolyticus EN9701072]EGQ8244422.1 restriction endonuclease subunit S [Vibrio parahaemolyticus]EGQ8387689.1 restriction endonuclease subunit S [Vibrio parahaemolyticus]EGQ8954861.1 restriction endonuclease subunit S [Vibrio parahaemolyticus]EGQ8989169.1 restriction endonuclease subunit S [Vibrio parahaemolyticus]
MTVENLITEHIDIWTSAVKTKSTSGRGSSKKLELYGVKKLRELILELAVQGKLVPQDPNDEPASVLLKRIAQEKAQLVKEKKLKKPKKLPNISDEEKPFDLPNGWSWIRLNEYGEWGSGSTPKRSNSGYYDGGIPWFKSGELKADYISESEETITELALSETSVRYNNVGDVLVAMYGATIGKTAILSVRATTNQAVCACTPFTGLSNTYLLTLLKAYKARLIGMGAGGAQPNISREKIINTVIALPSTAEQHRIVAKVDELMTLCDQLEQQTEASIEAHQVLVTTLLETLTNSADANELMQNWARISEHFDTLFSTEESIDQLKQTILQLAVMGKLVPQDPSDEPAAELLKRIADEKAQLVKDKKIKKQKALPPIAEDEKPFELPSGWEWCRLEDVVDIQSGITKGRKLAGRELKTIPYLSVANVQRGYLILNNVKEIDLPIDELEKYSVEDGDLLITEGGDWDKVGRTAIWRSEVPYMAHQNHVFKARPFLKEQSEAWLEMYLNGPFARKYFAGSSKQTTNLASINKTQLRSCLIAVPPRDEKKEISDRVQELIGMCDLLLEGIRASLQTQLQLTDVIVDQAV